MEFSRIEIYTKGWFIGDFNPTFLKTSEVEVAYKEFKAGDSEAAHKQLVATEISFFIQGEGMMNGRHFSKGDIVLIEPNEVADFFAITDCQLICVKTPSVPSDKVII